MKKQMEVSEQELLMERIRRSKVEVATGELTMCVAQPYIDIHGYSARNGRRGKSEVRVAEQELIMQRIRRSRVEVPTGELTMCVAQPYIDIHGYSARNGRRGKSEVRDIVVEEERRSTVNAKFTNGGG